MTQRAYYQSDALQMEAEALSCAPDGEGHFRVVLDATLFHPQGGGQPSDTGTIGAARVLKAMHEEGNVVHLTDRAVELGKVTIAVDAALRLLHTKYHSAGHLIGVAGEKYGWSATKGDHRPGEARVVFESTGKNSPTTAEAFAADAAEFVAAGLPRHQSEDDGKRMVTWGELHAYACGGTHVLSTSDVGEIRVTKIKEKKGQLSVYYQLGT